MLGRSKKITARLQISGKSTKDENLFDIVIYQKTAVCITSTMPENVYWVLIRCYFKLLSSKM